MSYFILRLEVLRHNGLDRVDKEVCGKTIIKLLQQKCYLLNHSFWTLVGLQNVFFLFEQMFILIVFLLLFFFKEVRLVVKPILNYSFFMPVKSRHGYFVAQIFHCLRRALLAGRKRSFMQLLG